MAHTHSHDDILSHSHDDPFNNHGHSHEILEGPGSYADLEMPLIEGRDWKERTFTVGIGGYVYLPSSHTHSPRLQSRTELISSLDGGIQTRRLRQDSSNARTVSRFTR